MIELGTRAIDAAIAGFLWPFVRILALIATAPVLGHRSVATRVKIALAALVTIIVAPNVTVPPATLASSEGVILLVQQILIGIAMGFALRLVTAAIELAGEVIGLQMGLNFAGFFDPSTTNMGTPIGAWLGMLVTLVFLAMNGHLLVIYGVAESFRVFPIATDALAADDWRRLVGLGADLFRIGLYVALPVIAAMLVCNLGLGVLARVAPQLNVLAVGFSITLIVGFVVLTAAMPFVGQYIETMLGRGFEMMLRR